MTSPVAGYSGTPLAKKLGIIEGCCVVVKYAPNNYEKILQPLPAKVMFAVSVSEATSIVHLFVDKKANLAMELEQLRRSIKPDGVVWVSWPKKSSKVSTDITEDSIRDLALPLGFVDIKVCAVDEIWSGLKLVIRKALR